MKALVSVLLLLLPCHVVAQSADELDIFAAMVEAPEGVPLATATAVSGDQDRAIYITGADVRDAEGACIRIWSEGPCHLISQTEAMTGQDDLLFVIIPAQQDDQIAKFSQMQMTRQPLVGVYDPETLDGLAFLTQNAFDGWERPITLAEPSGVSNDLTILKSSAFTEFSIGAPLVHPRDGLVGLVALSRDGSALMLPIRDALLATQDAGFPVQEWMLPDTPTESELPSRVASEIGRMIIFHDYSDIGYIGGFYGPSMGSGFDESFNTRVDYSVWEIDLNGPGGRVIAQDDRALPLIPTGMPMEAPFTGTPGDYLASCVIHATPSSEGRNVFVVQFWRNAPERFDPNVGSKDYDQAATPMIGWASDNTCASAIANMGAERLTTLSDGTVVAPEMQPGVEMVAPDGSGATSQDEGGSVIEDTQWFRVNTWNATGREALYRDLPDGHLLTVGCTDSRELVVAVSPGAEIARINNVATSAGPNGEAYAFLPGDLPDTLALQIGASLTNVPMTRDLLTCSPA